MQTDDEIPEKTKIRTQKKTLEIIENMKYEIQSVQFCQRLKCLSRIIFRLFSFE